MITVIGLLRYCLMVFQALTGVFCVYSALRLVLAGWSKW